MILTQPNSSVEEGSTWGGNVFRERSWIGVGRGQGQARPRAVRLGAVL